MYTQDVDEPNTVISRRFNCVDGTVLLCLRVDLQTQKDDSVDSFSDCDRNTFD